MKIYIAGPMSGLVEFNRPAFMLTAAKLAGRGHVALNPAILPDGLSQAEYMDICLAMLRCADAIYMLEGDEVKSLIAGYDDIREQRNSILPEAAGKVGAIAWTTSSG